MTRQRMVICAAAGVAVLATAGFGVLWFGFPGGGPAPMMPVKVQLGWKHQSDFAGYYAADQKGYYAEEALSVSFVAGGLKIDPLKAVLGGEARFGITNVVHLLHARARGEPVKAVCIYQRSPLIFAVKADSGITHPRQFTGKTIRLSVHNRVILDAMTGRFGITPQEYTLVETSDKSRFLSGEIDMWGGYISGGSQWILAARDRVHTIHPDDFGVHDYYLCLMTTDQVITKEPELVARVVRTTLRGWSYVAEHPEATGALTLAYDPTLDATVQTGRLKAVRHLFITDQGPVGWMKPERWSGLVEALRLIGAIDGPIDATELYTMRFLEEIYGTTS